MCACVCVCVRVYVYVRGRYRGIRQMERETRRVGYVTLTATLATASEKMIPPFLGHP